MSMERLMIGLIAAAFGAAVWWASGPVMRETDQASLVDGAWQLKQGKSPRAPGFHIYDKQFLAYALAAMVMPGNAILPAGEEKASEWVQRVNRLATVLFLAGLGVFTGCLCRRRFRCRGLAAPLLAFLTAPVILLSAPLASSAVMSAAFVLALAGVLSVRPFPLRPVVAGSLAFLAVGARADAVLCMPVLCWATARRPGWEALGRSASHWVMAAGSIGALVMGRWLAGGATQVIYERFFVAPIFFTYLLFGMGSLLWLMLSLIGGLAGRFEKHRSFRAAGIVFLLLPIGFYGLQLFSPRHLMTAALAVLIVAAGWRGRALARAIRMRKPRIARAFALVLVIASLAPLLIGLHLPSPQNPRLVFADATRFPTSDGLWPFGATGSFLARLRSSHVLPLDHNQAIWKAAIQDETFWPETDSVPVLETPMRRYLFLALRWAGREPVLLRSSESESWRRLGQAVADERSLRTLNPGQVNPAGLHGYESRLAGFRNARLDVISPEVGGQTVVKLSAAEKSRPPSRRDDEISRGFRIRRTLAVILRHEEIRWEGEIPGGFALELSRFHRGRTLVFTGRRPFGIDGTPANRVTDPDGSPLFTHVIPGERTLAMRRPAALAIESEFPVTFWSAVLPDYMSRNRFRSERDGAASRKSGRRPPREIAARSGNSEARDASVR